MSMRGRREKGGGAPSGTNASLLLGEKINTSRSRAGLFGQEVESSF